jgi:hypothetical protein
VADEKRDNRGAQRPGGEGQGRRHGRRHSGHGHEGESRKQAPAEPQVEAQVESRDQTEAQTPRAEPLNCPLCGKPVYDLSTALCSDRETGAPAHFDCVLERVAASESLAGGEKIVYLGAGAFGVVEYKDKSETSFTVKRRIQWEKEGEKKDWRKSLSSRISNL